jgi:hypothetical protein
VMGMNLDELEQQQSAQASRLNRMHQVYGSGDYIPRDQKYLPAGPVSNEDGLVDARVTVVGPIRSNNDWSPLPRGECNSVSGYWAKCERGTVGCTNHRSGSNRSPGFFSCRIHHHDSICKCSQPVIVNQVMLDNAQSAALHVIGALKGDVKSSKLTREDLDYLAIHVARMMAHWARKALGHTPEQEL